MLDKSKTRVKGKHIIYYFLDGRFESIIMWVSEFIKRPKNSYIWEGILSEKGSIIMKVKRLYSYAVRAKNIFFIPIILL